MRISSWASVLYFCNMRLFRSALLLTVASISLFGCKTKEIYEAQEALPHIVDLGLTSGLKWASCNVGTNIPEEFGWYFQWGDTDTWGAYGLFNYKWVDNLWDGTYPLKKYNYDSTQGYCDNLTTLENTDDAAEQIWSDGWHIPTMNDWQELLNECKWSWGERNDVAGFIVTGSNGNSLFLPASGYADGLFEGEMDAKEAGCTGYYWSRNLDLSDPYSAQCLGFYAEEAGDGYYVEWHNTAPRYRGLTVRAVKY